MPSTRSFENNAAKQRRCCWVDALGVRIRLCLGSFLSAMDDADRDYDLRPPEF